MWQDWFEKVFFKFQWDIFLPKYIFKGEWGQTLPNLTFGVRKAAKIIEWYTHLNILLNSTQCNFCENVRSVAQVLAESRVKMNQNLRNILKTFERWTLKEFYSLKNFSTGLQGSTCPVYNFELDYIFLKIVKLTKKQKYVPKKTFLNTLHIMSSKRLMKQLTQWKSVDRKPSTQKSYIINNR